MHRLLVATAVAASVLAATPMALAAPAAPSLSIDAPLPLPADAPVTVSGAGFAPGLDLELAICLQRDPSRCAGSFSWYGVADDAGALSISGALPRVVRLTDGARVDCAEQRCVLVARRFPDTLASLPVRFVATPLPEPLRLTATIHPGAALGTPRFGATVRATITCNRPVLVSGGASLLQRQGRWLVRARGPLGRDGQVLCGDRAAGSGGTVEIEAALRPKDRVVVQGAAVATISIGAWTGPSPDDQAWVTSRTPVTVTR